MELRHLRYFIAVAEAENVSRAALKLHLSQPALSRQIHDLEAELGFPLFIRTAKSLRLSEAGRTFLAEAREVLQRAEVAVNAAREVALGAAGELHIGYAPSPTVRFLPGTLRAFQTRVPQVRVRLHDMSTQEMVAGVRSGQLNLAFVVKPNGRMLRGLEFEELARDAMRLAVPPEHPLAKQTSITAAHLLNETLVVFSRKEYPEYYEYLENLFTAIKGTPRIGEEHDGSASLIAAIESGSGAAILPESFACSAGPRLKLIPLTPRASPIVIGALVANKGLTPVAESLLECARTVAGRTQQTGGVL